MKEPPENWVCLLRASSELTPEIQTINTASVPELNHSTHKLHRKRGWKHNDALAWVNLPFAKHLAKYFESGDSGPLPYNVLPWIKMSPNSKFPGNHTYFKPQVLHTPSHTLGSRGSWQKVANSWVNLDPGCGVMRSREERALDSRNGKVFLEVVFCHFWENLVLTGPGWPWDSGKIGASKSFHPLGGSEAGRGVSPCHNSAFRTRGEEESDFKSSGGIVLSSLLG